MREVTGVAMRTTGNPWTRTEGGNYNRSLRKRPPRLLEERRRTNGRHYRNAGTMALSATGSPNPNPKNPPQTPPRQTYAKQSKTPYMTASTANRL